MTDSLNLEDLNLDDLNISEEPIAERKTRRPRSDAGKPRGPRGTGTGRGRTALAEQLLVPWATLAAIVSQPLPLVGAVLITRGEATTKALVDLAKDHPKMLAALTKVAKAGPASELVQTGALLLAAVAIETGRIPADLPVMQRLSIDGSNTSITDLYYELHPDRVPAPPDVEDIPFPYAPGMQGMDPFTPPGFGAAA